MKVLYVVRHAKSSWENTDLSDFERPLNERGEKDAPRMGKRLKERGVLPDIIYASPAIRAWTTAVTIAKILGYDAQGIQSERKLYHADENVLLQSVRHISESIDSVMMVGHNPGLTEFVNDLLEDNIENIPTAGVVAAQLRIDSWKKADWKCGELVFFDFPKK